MQRKIVSGVSATRRKETVMSENAPPPDGASHFAFDLGLAGDGDEIYLVRTVEESFGIKFAVPDLERVVDVGELHDLILKAIPTKGRSNGPCLTAVAYYRLRRAIASSYPAVTLSPASRLAEIVPPFRRARLVKEWERETGLTLSALHLGFLGVGCVIAAVLAIPAATIMASWVVFLSMIAASVLMGWPAARVFPGFSSETVGELAKRAVAFNIAKLSRAHASLRPKDVWDALVLICQYVAPRKGQIGPRTRFIKP